MLRVDKIRVSYDGVPALADAELEVEKGEQLAVLGPSGSGKSTLLRVVAGLLRPEAGRVLLAGRDIVGIPSHRREIGLMHQDGALFPHLDVAGNVEFGLRMAGLRRVERERRTAKLLELVGLPGFERRSLAGLSGGEQQRVGLARALAPEPRVLLLDEPLGSLDRPLRERLVEELSELFERLGLTVIHVTHDVGEAFAIGDRVAVMHEGRVVQHATPDDLWARPADEWIANFLGMTNIREQDGRRVVVRPEAVRLTPGDAAVVVAVQRRGPAVHSRVRLEDGEILESVSTGLEHPQLGDRVGVEVDRGGIIDLDPLPPTGAGFVR
ncbi:MAG: ABC transporter ATP-binding protein [Gaiellaceae bacterium]